MTTPSGIDPRGPRFGAAITSLLLVIDIVLGLVGNSVSTVVRGDWALPGLGLIQRITDPGFLLLLVIAALFLWGVLSPRTQPWSLLFRTVVQPRLPKPTELEDPRPPRFSQGVGLFVTVVGLLLHVIGVPLALPVAAAAAFVAAFLNAAFGYCLGCQLYLLLQRAGVIGRARAVS